MFRTRRDRETVERLDWVMNSTPRAQDAHDFRDAGGRATQEQLPRSGGSQFCTEPLPAWAPSIE